MKLSVTARLEFYIQMSYIRKRYILAEHGKQSSGKSMSPAVWRSGYAEFGKYTILQG
jgi:hypothetical protein